MIPKEQLRIGNLVILAHESNTPIATIKELRDKFALVDDNVEVKWINYDLLLPIELNEDWLVKLGWILEGQSHYKHAHSDVERIDKKYVRELYNFENNRDMHIEVFLAPNDGSVRRIGVCGFKYSGMNGVMDTPLNIRYVHTLQNIYFAFNNEELNLKEPNNE